MKQNYIIYAILVLAAATLVISFTGFSVMPAVTSSSSSSQDAGLASIDSGSTSRDDVSVELTPEEINGGQLKVGIAVNTHSVDLSPFDLNEITTLEYNGKSVNPISSPRLAGHHSSGTLVFNVDSKVNAFRIIIRGIPQVEERVFEW